MPDKSKKQKKSMAAKGNPFAKKAGSKEKAVKPFSRAATKKKY